MPRLRPRLRTVGSAAAVVAFASTARGDPPASPGPGTLVHVDAPSGAWLEVMSPEVDDWQLACTAPCDTTLARDREYRVAGPLVRPSWPFRLAAAQQVVRLDSVASRSAFGGGIALVVIGGLAATGGFVSAGGAGLGAALGSNGGDSAFNVQTVETVGCTVGAVGTAALFIGVALIAVNVHSGVTEDVTRVTGAGDARETGWLRSPVWRSLEPDTVAGPRSLVFPVLSRRF